MKDAKATAEVVFSLGVSEAHAIGRGMGSREKEVFGEKICAAVLNGVWAKKAKGVECPWGIRKGPAKIEERFYPILTQRLSGALELLSTERAAYLFGQLYTCLMPEEKRKSLGAYYTPPPVVDRLLQLATQTGFDWETGTIIDPACGGAAFLSPLATRLLKADRGTKALRKLERLESRLAGIELDPFAAWLSMVLLDLALLPLCVAAGRPAANLVQITNALEIGEEKQFDLVIGNPPYGKVGLQKEQREKFQRTLFGHANLYGIFTEIGVKLCKPGGHIAYVTPTSFLGGEYFKCLRSFLSANAPLQQLDFVSARDRVFEGVLQETMLAVFGKLPQSAGARVIVNLVHADEPTEPVTVEEVGQSRLNGNGGGIWLLPRSAKQVGLVEKLHQMGDRLENYGFEISTGQLVWNRHKDQLRSAYGKECYPIIWAEAVSPDGAFSFQAARRNHLPYIRLNGKQEWLINVEPCVLVQRTTAKEQRRRIIAAVMPNSFVCENAGYVVENHLNMVYSQRKNNPIGLQTIAALLNSEALDQAFRCINGSVAVSAYELSSLPLPNEEQIIRLQRLLLNGATHAQIEKEINYYYGLGNEGAPARNYSGTGNRKVAA